MQPVRVCVGDRDCGVQRHLALERNSGLHEVGSAQCGTDLLDGAGGHWSGQSRDGGHGGKKVRVRDYVLLLDHAVVALGGENVREAEAVVKHAESGADHALGP